LALQQFKFAFVCVISLLLATQSIAQEPQLAAVLEVLSPGVTVQRVNTANPIAVSVEAVVGVGDVIRTDETGEARITFFDDGTETDLTPNTEYRINTFMGDTETFSISVEVLAGETIQRLNSALDANSNYEIETPGMALAARGTVFALRVEDNGRSGMIVSEGAVAASAADEPVSVEAQFGVRSPAGEPLSDVVRASTFEELYDALDGCNVVVPSLGDVRLNVRLAPNLDAQRVGTIAPSQIDLFVGTNEGGEWYRVPFREGFGWVQVTSADIQADCSLRLFTDDQQENPEAYEFLGDPIDMEPTPEPTPTVTEAADTGDDDAS